MTQYPIIPVDHPADPLHIDLQLLADFSIALSSLPHLIGRFQPLILAGAITITGQRSSWQIDRSHILDGRRSDPKHLRNFKLGFPGTLKSENLFIDAGKIDYNDTF